MTGSKLYPRLGYKSDEEETGGYLGKNRYAKSANAPHWKGKFYLVGYGWIWLSGWNVKKDGEPFIRLAGNDMSDEEAEKYRAPKEGRGGGPTTRRPPQHNGQIPANSGEDEIPF